VAAKTFDAGTAQTVIPEDLYLRSALLTAGSADATCVIYANGVVYIKIAAKAGTSQLYPSTTGGNQFSLENIKGPVTVDVVGTGSFLRLSY